MRKAKIIWNWLTEPSPSVQRSHHRRQARLISSLLLFQLLLGIVLVMLDLGNIEPTDSYTGFYLSLGTLIGLILAYALSRTRHYKLGAALAVALMSLGIFGLTFYNDYPVYPMYWTIYLNLPVLIASMVFSLDVTFFVVLLNTAGILLVVAVMPGVTINDSPLGYFIIISGLILLSIDHRNKLERDRQAELAASEERFRLLAENAQDVIYRIRLTPTVKFEYISPAIEDLTPYTPQEHCADPSLIFRRIHPDDRHLLEPFIQQEIPQESLVLRWIGEDGRVVWTEQRNTPVYDEEGNLIVLEGIARDITERKRAEEALRESESRFRQLAENIKEVFWLRTADRFLYVSPAYEEIWGQSRESLYQQSEAQLEQVHPEDRQRLMANYSLSRFETDEVFVEEFRVVRPDGSQRWILSRSFPVQGEDDEVKKRAGIAEDITERKRAEEEIRQRTGQLEALRQLGLELMAELDLDTLLHSIVSQAVELLDGSSGGLYLYRPEQDRLEWAVKVGSRLPPLGNFLQRGEGISGKVWETGEALIISDREGLEEPLDAEETPYDRAVAVPIRRGEEFLGVLKIFADPPRTFTQDDVDLLSLFATHAAITIDNARLYQALRQQAEELADAVERLEELDQLKSEFIQNVSHELRSPLALIRGYAEMLNQGELGELRAEQQGPVEVIARRSHMLGELVEDIMLILEVEVTTPPREPVQLGELARDVAEDFQVVAHQAELTLETDIATDLPPTYGAQMYLRRVMDNLIGNAIKFTPEEGQITLRVRRQGDHIALQVSDTGIGISPDQQRRIFERFYQVDGSSRRRYGGTGLGLALVKEIVEAYGGEVGVESQVGQGSTFTVTLPIYGPLRRLD